MEITTDIVLKGKVWNSLISGLSKIFAGKTNYDIFVLCASIGIMYDKKIDVLDADSSDEPKYVPKVVLGNHRDVIELLFQTAILTTNTILIDEEERLQLAFDDTRTEFKRFDFLLGFANYGASKLAEMLGKTDIATMENLRSYINAVAEDFDLDLSPLTDEEAFSEEIDE